MICVIALIVFGILGIFSAKYRIIAKESFNCVFKKITLRKCDTGLDVRLKSEITGKFMRWSPRFGRVLYKYFEWFSWALLILTIVTLYFFGQGVYFYAIYGNCNGPNSNAFCIFDPLGTNNKPQNVTEGSECHIPGNLASKVLTAPSNITLKHGVFKGNIDASVVIIEFGCYSCHFTKQAESTVKEITDHYGDKILYVYMDFPLNLTHANAIKAAEGAHCALDQGKYWEYRDYLFANQQDQYPENLTAYAADLGLNTTQFKECLDNDTYYSVVEDAYNKGLDSGISVTPTFFINNESLVGAVDYSQFHKIINKELGIPWWMFWK